jgi:deoxyribodipyrimidine photolyase
LGKGHVGEARERGIAMTELKEELKVTPDEEPVEYVERAEAALDQHYRETGERLSVWSTIPGEGPGEVLERLKVVKEVDAIRGAGRAREARRQERAEEAHRKDATGGESTHHRNYRAKSQERDIERAVSEFEVAKQRLYRSDGTKVYGEGEHAERLENLTEGLREKGEAVAREAHEDAEGYDKEALALSYVDPPSRWSPAPRGGA